MRRYSDKTALKKIHEILDPVLEHLRWINHSVYFSYWSVTWSRESYCYIELAWAKNRNHHVFSWNILKWWKWHDVYEELLNKKDSIYYVLKEYLVCIEN
jgi:hypothetical protein